jgi:hypothetical protein
LTVDLPPTLRLSLHALVPVYFITFRFKLVFTTQSNPDVVSVVVSRNSLRYVGGDGKSKYCVIGIFCSQTFMGDKWGWHCIGGCFVGGLPYFLGTRAVTVRVEWHGRPGRQSSRVSKMNVVKLRSLMFFIQQILNYLVRWK